MGTTRRKSVGARTASQSAANPTRSAKVQPQSKPEPQTPAPVAANSGKALPLAICVGLALLVALVFGQSVGFDFINYDDDVYVYENPHVGHGLSLRGVEWALTHSVNANWHPVTVLSYMLDSQFYRLKPGGYHFTNVWLHGMAAILLFLFLERLTAARWRSAFVAMLFAIHPLRAESVAWVAERKDVLSGVFFMLTLGAYVWYTREPRRVLRYLTVLFFFALGLMSKPTVVPLPFVLLLLDYWPLKRFRTAANNAPNTISPGRLFLEKIPLFVLSAAACFATLAAQQKALATLPFYTRLANACVSYAIYLWQMVWPANLAAFYPMATKGPPPWEVGLSLLVLAGISTAAFLWRRQRPWLLVSWLWYLVMLLPVIGLVQVGSQAHADRYTYLPQIGLYLIIACAVGEWMAGRQRVRQSVGAVAVAVAVALVLCASNQVSFWRNSQTLWEHTLAVSGDSDLAHNNLGLALAEKGKWDEAIPHYQQSLEINPDLALAHNNLGLALVQKGDLDGAIARYRQCLELSPGYDRAHFNLGVALVQKGQFSDAIDQFQHALKLNPDYALASINIGNILLRQGNMDEAVSQYRQAIEINPDSDLAYNDLGTAFIKKGQLDEAIVQYRMALKINPAYTLARLNLANALSRQGRVDDAIAEYEAALKTDPNLEPAHIGLGNALLQRGHLDDAISHFEHGLELNPGNAAICNAVAWRLATAPQAPARNGDKALQLARQLNQLAQGKNPAILQTLAAAYAETGQFPEAASTAQQALLLANASGNGLLAGELKRQCDTYQAGQPFRDANLTNAATHRVPSDEP